eukprot:2688287-Rhodomonas_salina.1
MSGTRYAMSGTDVAYDATPRPCMRCPVLRLRMVLRGVRYWDSVCCYGASGTETADAATRYVQAQAASMLLKRRAKVRRKGERGGRRQKGRGRDGGRDGGREREG